jgi:hypothetical protein
MADDFELLLVQIGVNEAIPRRIVDGYQPEFALLITSQNDAQPLLEWTGKNFSQVSGPKFCFARHEMDIRRVAGGSQVTTRTQKISLDGVLQQRRAR